VTFRSCGISAQLDPQVFPSYGGIRIKMLLDLHWPENRRVANCSTPYPLYVSQFILHPHYQKENALRLSKILFKTKRYDGKHNPCFKSRLRDQFSDKIFTISQCPFIRFRNFILQKARGRYFQFYEFTIHNYLLLVTCNDRITVQF
jgi:hypothetical protein